jgi:hypothetical protein
MGYRQYKWKWVVYPDLISQERYNVPATTVWKMGESWMTERNECIRAGIANEPTIIDRFGGPELIVMVWDTNFMWEFPVDTSEGDTSYIVLF